MIHRKGELRLSFFCQISHIHNRRKLMKDQEEKKMVNQYTKEFAAMNHKLEIVAVLTEDKDIKNRSHPI